tara:strand:- start:17003 stop:18802 length:1800 start_codon:yes stop_codon:yes gene_type:complete
MAGQATAGQEHLGHEIFLKHCASCHMGGVERAPHLTALNMMPYDSLLVSLQTGLMRTQADVLSDNEKQLVAEYLSGGGPVDEAIAMPAQCAGVWSQFDYDQPPMALGWGIDLENTHFIDGETAGINPNEVRRLSLKWAFAYPNANRARSQPSFAGGALVVGSQDGTVYSLDAATGCIRWTFKASAEVRTGITYTAWAPGEVPDEPPLAYFADLMSWVYAVNATNGELVWSQKVGLHPNATTTAQPVLFDGTIFQPVSSLEVVPALDPDYPCCSFRGSIVALDARTGEQKWRTYTITEELVQTRINDAGTPNFGPSGAPIWNSPTVDEKRRLLYVGTGENYSSPAQGSSDAVIAFKIDTGEIAWVRQTTAGDAWNMACMPNTPTPENCPEEIGPDVDFASPPILVREGGREILVAAQKNGQAHGIDPESGKQVWRTQVGRGGNQGGTHFGIAAEGTTVFIPMSDYDDRMLPIEEAKPGIFGLDAFTGEIKWSNIAKNFCGERDNCDPGVSSAVTAIPGVVFAGHMDGRLRAYDTATGDVIWETETDRAFQTINGVEAHGGSFGGGSAPIVKDGHLYVNSGYGIYFHMPGNVLLVFSVDGD